MEVIKDVKDTVSNVQYITILLSCLLSESAESNNPHFFKQMNFARLVACFVCRKPFSGFLSNGLKCQGNYEIFTCIYPITGVLLNHYVTNGDMLACDLKCHRHCAARAKPCLAHIDAGMVVSRENEKVVTSLDDVDKLGRFLVEKVS